MECQVRRADAVAEVVLRGSLDSSWAPYLSDQVDELVRAGAVQVWFDMSGVTYLSSHGIAIIIRFHRQLQRIGGRVRIIAGSELVTSVLKLSGVARFLDLEEERPARDAAPRPAHDVLEYDGMLVTTFSGRAEPGPAVLTLHGDPARLPDGGYGSGDLATWHAAPGSVAFGLGALGPSFEECRGRFGEFVAVGGVAAYRPSGGAGRPDFEHAAGAFVPAVRVLYGLSFSTAAARVIRFEAALEESASVPLGKLAKLCLDQSAGSAVGVVIAGESDGLVGAAIRRSPIAIADGTDPFAYPGIREWLSITPEPEHSRGMALAVGVATRASDSVLAPFVRPLQGGGPPEPGVPITGHFHAVVVPYRPIPGGAIELEATVAHLFEPGRIETILHLIGDLRPIVGAGESKFKRGAIWYVPLAVDEGVQMS